MKPLEDLRDLLPADSSFPGYSGLPVMHAIEMKAKLASDNVKGDFEFTSPQRGYVKSIKQRIRNRSEWDDLQEVLSYWDARCRA